MKLFIGIDPGAKGGIAALDGDGQLILNCRFDDEDPGEVAMAAITTAQKIGSVEMVALEKVGAAPGQGVTSMFTFGVGVGLIKGWLRAGQISFIEVAPVSWQRVTFGEGPPKERALNAAKTLWGIEPFIPTGCRVPHNGMIDAALLAEYLRRTIMGGGNVVPIKPTRRKPVLKL